MAKRDFDDYYNKVYAQFHSLQEAFNEMNEEVNNGMVEPERLEQLKLTIAPIKESYQTLSYIKYLIDKPAKKRKLPRYKQMNKKLLDLADGHKDSDVLKRNSEILQSLKQ